MAMVQPRSQNRAERIRNVKNDQNSLANEVGKKWAGDLPTTIGDLPPFTGDLPMIRPPRFFLVRETS